MEKLTIENFIAAADDFEMSKYIILARLKKYSAMLHKNKLYPALSDLIDIGKVLHELNNQQEKIECMTGANLRLTHSGVIIDRYILDQRSTAQRR